MASTLRRSTKPGQLYGCGMAKAGLLQSFLAPGAVDAEGDCCFPAKLKMGTTDGFVRVSCDMNTFAALDSRGDVWFWGINDRCGFSSAPTRLCAQSSHKVAGKCIDCSTGLDFVTSVTEAGEVYLFGKCSHLGKHVESVGTFGKLECWRLVLPSAIAANGDDKVVMCEACAKDIVLLSQRGVPFAVTGDGIRPLPNISVPVGVVSLGSLSGAAAAADGQSMWVWGDGLSGNFGVGKRMCSKEPLEAGEFFRSRGLTIADVKCTRGQPGCKRSEKPKPGEEGPRMHVVTTDGSLYIAGTSHKGLCADHFWKVMQPSKDQLVFYKVGGPAQDAMPNAPAFDSADSNDAAAPSSEPPASSGVLQASNTPDSAPDQPSAAGLDQAVSESDHTPTAAASASAAETETAPSRTTSSGSAAGADVAAPKKNANSKAASARTVVRSASSAAKVDQSRSMAPPAAAAATGAAEDLLRSNIAGRCSEAEAYARMGMRRGAFEFGKTRDTGYLSCRAVVLSEPSSIHSLALSHDGRAHAWGCGSDGRAGLAAFLRGPGGAKRKLKCYISSPTAELQGCLFVAAGKYWSLFIVDEARA
mmetsp:Transcript_59950/g.141354  ORF Transcript_59950/g.141354 Transcript_59950/m.141354 type:complete len:586 (+) Transcript_59950:202-1959(+)